MHGNGVLTLFVACLIPGLVSGMRLSVAMVAASNQCWGEEAWLLDHMTVMCLSQTL